MSRISALFSREGTTISNEAVYRQLKYVQMMAAGQPEMLIGNVALARQNHSGHYDSPLNPNVRIRHTDSFGHVIFDNQGHYSQTKEARSVLDLRANDLNIPQRTVASFMHARLRTTGSLDYGNIQPMVQEDDSVYVHNGTIGGKVGGIERENGKSDSMYLSQLIYDGLRGQSLSGSSDQQKAYAPTPAQLEDILVDIVSKSDRPDSINVALWQEGWSKAYALSAFNPADGKTSLPNKRSRYYTMWINSKGDLLHIGSENAFIDARGKSIGEFISASEFNTPLKNYQLAEIDLRTFEVRKHDLSNLQEAMIMKNTSLEHNSYVNGYIASIAANIHSFGNTITQTYASLTSPARAAMHSLGSWLSYKMRDTLCSENQLYLRGGFKIVSEVPDKGQHALILGNSITYRSPINVVTLDPIGSGINQLVHFAQSAVVTNPLGIKQGEPIPIFVAGDDQKWLAVAQELVARHPPADASRQQ